MKSMATRVAKSLKIVEKIVDTSQCKAAVSFSIWCGLWNRGGPNENFKMPATDISIEL